MTLVFPWFREGGVTIVNLENQNRYDSQMFKSSALDSGSNHLGPHWYVVRTEPRGEYLAADELRRHGFEVVLPLARTPIPRKGHGDLPLFPGYLFLKCDATTDGMPSLAMATHVFGWLNFGGVVPPLPDGSIEQLIERMETINHEGGLWRRFRRGNKVRVDFGGRPTLAEVVEDAKSPQARVWILMEFMGRSVSAHVPWENLQSVKVDSADSYRVPRRTRGSGRWIQGFGTRAGTGA